SLRPCTRPAAAVPCLRLRHPGLRQLPKLWRHRRTAMAWSRMTSMEMDDDDKLDSACPAALESVPDYPWGLRISLTHRELEKLGLEADCDIGDVIDLRAFARVCSVSSNETSMGPE